MVRPDNVRATIDSLHANVAILDSHGEITEVNEGWRRFGGQRNGASDCVGLNYVAVCRKAADTGDGSAKRVADGLQRLLSGRAVSYGIVYRCGECTFRMTARRVSHPDGGVIVAHQDITALLAARQARNMARRERDTSRRELHEACVTIRLASRTRMRNSVRGLRRFRWRRERSKSAETWMTP